MTDPDSHPGAQPGAGSRPGRRTRGRPAGWLPLAVLALVVLAGIIIVLLVRGGSSDGGAGGSGSGGTAAGRTAGPQPVSPGAAGSQLPPGFSQGPPAAGTTPRASATALSTVRAGTTAGDLVAGEGTRQTSVFPLGASEDLSRYAGQPASASLLLVQSVPADEGFWVGASARQRVWVQLSGVSRESPFQVKAGQRLTFAGGRFAATDSGFPQRVGVTADEGAAQLVAQRQHVEVPVTMVRMAP